MAESSIDKKLVTAEQVKFLTGKIQSDIDDTADAGEENATAIAALQSTTATHTTDIAALQSTDATHTTDIAALKTTTGTHTTQIQEIKDSVATMDEFKSYMGLNGD